MRRPSAIAAGAVAGVLALAGAASAAPGDLEPSFGDGGRMLLDVGDDVHAFTNVEGFAAVDAPGGGAVVVGMTARGSRWATLRLGPDWALDRSLGDNGLLVATGHAANAAAFQPDGKLVVVGSLFGGARLVVRRYGPDGAPDPGFGSGGTVVTPTGSRDESGGATSIAIQPDGRLVVAGSTSFGDPRRGHLTRGVVVRYLPDGGLDRSFGNGGKRRVESLETVAKVVLQGRRIVLAGSSPTSGGFTLTRMRADGAVDRSFGRRGVALAGSRDGCTHATALLVQPGGKLLAGGEHNADGVCGRVGALVRFNRDGSVDRGFGRAGLASIRVGGGYRLASLAQVGGTTYALGSSGSSPTGSGDFAVTAHGPDGARLRSFGAGGTVKTSFGTGCDDVAEALLPQPDGSLVAVGTSARGERRTVSLSRYLTR